MEVGLGVVAFAGLALAAIGCGGSRPPGHVAFEKKTAARAMAAVFSHRSPGSVPPDVAAAVSRLAKGAKVGTVRVDQGRLLLSSLGPKHRSIYVFPTTNGEVCFDITRLAEGCKKAFVVGQPASVDGDTLYFPATSGPPAELAGLTEDGVSRVQVVLNGKAHNAVFGHDAWYYRFPGNHVDATAATKLTLTLKGGSTSTVPTGIVKPKLP